MKNLLISFLAIIAFLLASVCESSAQGTANFPVSEENLQYVLVKGQSYVNIRKEPSANAQVVDILSQDMVLPTFGEKNGWYYIASTSGQPGWIKSSVVRLSTAKFDAATMLEKRFGRADTYEYGVAWTIAKVSDMPDTYVAYTICIGGSLPGYKTLWIGGKIKEGFIFTKRVSIETELDNSLGSNVNVKREKDSDNENIYNIKFSKRNAITNRSTDGRGIVQEDLNPAALTKKLIDFMFDGTEKEDKNFFLAPELMQGKYKNMIFE